VRSPGHWRGRPAAGTTRAGAPARISGSIDQVGQQRDVTHPALAAAIDAMVAPWRDANLQAVMGIESRGFILGAAMARVLGVGFVPVRKPGKLPGKVLRQDYTLEYRPDSIEVHADALSAGARVLVVDDVLATGGTLLAALSLARQLQVEVVGAAVLVELAGLGGRERWMRDVPLLANLVY
jgi:adenine phosphoribosyltransferase